jgi:3-(3-hydroxy-phenyl)propionate hydroxylase
MAAVLLILGVWLMANAAMLKQQPRTCDKVLVLGAGPVGLSCALALHALSFPVEVLEADKEETPRLGGRALYLHRDSLKLFERFSPGLGHEAGRRGERWRYRETYWGKRLVYRHDLSQEGHFSQSGLPAFTSLRQPDTEALLREVCKASGIPIHWGSPVTAVRADAHGVCVDHKGGSQRVAYVVGADGARSVTRKQIDVTMQGNTASGCHVVVDFKGPSGPCVDRRVFHYHHPALGGRHVLMIPFAGGWQVDLQCREDDDVDAMSRDEGLHGWLRRVLNTAQLSQLVSVSTYRFNQVVADNFADAHKRVLLVGEAAHLFPPYGARGLNSGIADADAAAAAIALASCATSEVRRVAAIDDFVRDRRTAALRNCDAATQALQAIRACRARDQWRQRMASLVSPWSRSAARWLDAAPYGPVYADHRRLSRY